MRRFYFFRTHTVIVLILLLATLYLIFNLASKYLKKNSPPTHAQQNIVCQINKNLPIEAPKGYVWRALDCHKSCRNNADCPQNQTNTFPYKSKSNWCYGNFDVGARCIMLEYSNQPQNKKSCYICSKGYRHDCADGTPRTCYFVSRNSSNCTPENSAWYYDDDCYGKCDVSCSSKTDADTAAFSQNETSTYKETQGNKQKDRRNNNAKKTPQNNLGYNPGYRININPKSEFYPTNVVRKAKNMGAESLQLYINGSEGNDDQILRAIADGQKEAKKLNIELSLRFGDLHGNKYEDEVILANFINKMGNMGILSPNFLLILNNESPYWEPHAFEHWCKESKIVKQNNLGCNRKIILDNFGKYGSENRNKVFADMGEWLSYYTLNVYKRLKNKNYAKNIMFMPSTYVDEPASPNLVRKYLSSMKDKGITDSNNPFAPIIAINTYMHGNVKLSNRLKEMEDLVKPFYSNLKIFVTEGGIDRNGNTKGIDVSKQLNEAYSQHNDFIYRISLFAPDIKDNYKPYADGALGRHYMNPGELNMLYGPTE